MERNLEMAVAIPIDVGLGSVKIYSDIFAAPIDI
jgi:hypothetical protein